MHPTSHLHKGGPMTRQVSTLALLALLLPAGSLAGQEPPALPPQDAEAYGMSESMQFGCSPQRAARVPESQSVIEGGQVPLIGTAAFFLQDEGMFLVLEDYADDGSRHCLVFAHFGSPPAPGRYAVKKLARRTAEAEATTERRAFFGVFGYRTDTEAAMLVFESGFVEIAPSEPDQLTGTFHVEGFMVDGADRRDGVVRHGSFSARQTE